MVRSYLGKPGMVLVKALVAMIVFVAASWFIGVHLEQQFNALWASLACAIGIYLLVLVRRLHLWRLGRWNTPFACDICQGHPLRMQVIQEGVESAVQERSLV